MNEPRGRGLGERRFRLLLRLLPSRFRDAYGEGLEEVFAHHRDQRLANAGRLGIGFWWFIAIDMVSTAWRERRHPIRGGGEDTTRGGDGMRGWVDDLSYATRRLLRSPGFSLTAVAILVLGIGVNTTVFSVVNSLLFQPPPFADAASVVDILQDSDDGRPNSTSYPAYEDIARTPEVFQAVAAINTNEAFLEGPDGLAPIRVEYASASYMEVLGLSPSRGRWFDGPEDGRSGPPTAVVSHKMWQDRMASDPDVVGSTLRIGGSAVTVVGVGPVEYNGGSGPAVIDLWLSMSALAPTGGSAARSLDRREDHPFLVRARLLPGVSVDRARTAMDGLAADLAATYPDLNRDRRIHVIPTAEIRIAPEVDGQLAPAAALVMIVVGLVLVIATLNLANLLVVRTSARARELAVRLAMGAGRGRVMRVVLSEAIVLAFVGAIGGLGVAAWLVRGLESGRFQSVVPLILDIRLDASVLLFTGAIAVVSGCVFGLLPAYRVARRDLNASLRDESTSGLGARRRFGVTGVLVVGQVAVSLVLLTVAGVFLDSLLRARAADPGFDWESALAVSMSLSPLGVGVEEANTIHTALLERMEADPQIEAAALALQLPGAQRGTTTLLLGAGLGEVDRPREIPWNLIDRHYFDVLGIPLVAGRTFEAADLENPSIAIVSEALARAYWGRSDVVGEALYRENDPDTPIEIVGVVGDATVRSLAEEPTPSAYFFYTGGGVARASFVMRASGSPDRAAAVARDIIRAYDPRILVTGSTTMEAHLGSTLAQQRVAGMVLSGLGGLALLLVVLGVYGVVSFAVAGRRQEVGIRQALGARPQEVVGLFVRDVAGVVLTGTAIGLVLSVPLGHVIGMEFTGRAGGVFLPAVASGLLLMTALAATLVPAASAARNDPKRILAKE